MRVGLSPTAIFGDLSGYFFGNFRDKASNIIMTIGYPLFDCDWRQTILYTGPWLSDATARAGYAMTTTNEPEPILMLGIEPEQNRAVTVLPNQKRDAASD